MTLAAYDGLRGLELRVLHSLNCDHAGPALDALAAFTSHLAFGACVIALLLLVPSLRARARARLPRALVAGLLAVGLVHGLKQVTWWTWQRPRPGDLFTPAETLEGVVAIGTCGENPDKWVKRGHAPNEPSFPSSHVVTVGAAAAAVWFVSRWTGAVAWLYALLVGVGRMYWGKHWPTDVLGSLALCAIVGWGSWRLAPRLQSAVAARWRARQARRPSPL